MKTTLTTIFALSLLLGPGLLFADNSKSRTTYQAVDMIALPIDSDVGPNPGDDFNNPAIEISIFSASGAISAHNGSGEEPAGVINVDISTVAGVYPQELFVLGFPDGTGTFGNKLNRGNGFGAEIHVVVDKHPVLSTWVEELTTTNWGPDINHRAAVFLPKRPSH